MRIDNRPLALPIAAHPVASVDVASFHSIRPNDLGVDGREKALDLTAIEKGIDPSDEFDVIRHAFNLEFWCGGVALLPMSAFTTERGSLALHVQVDVAAGCGKRARA